MLFSWVRVALAFACVYHEAAAGGCFALICDFVVVRCLLGRRAKLASSQVQLGAPRGTVLTTTRRSSLTFDDVDGEAAAGGFFVFVFHVAAGVAHGFDYFVERDEVRAVAAQCHARGVDGVDGGYGVALYTRYLHKAADGVAGKAEVVLHGDLGGVLNLHGVAAHELCQPTSRHGAGAADFALAANFSSRDRGVLFVQDADGASGEQKAFDASAICAGEEVAVIV